MIEIDIKSSLFTALEKVHRELPLRSTIMQFGELTAFL